MQGGKGKVERRLISFSLSGVTSLGRVEERGLLTPTPSTTFPLPLAWVANSSEGTTSLFTDYPHPSKYPKAPCFPKKRAQMEAHDTAYPTFCNVYDMGVVADKGNIQPCHCISLLATAHLEV